MRTVVVALAAAGVAALTPHARADEAKALAVVKRLGGEVERDDKRPGKPVVRVDLSTKKVTDDDLKLLKEFKELENVQLAFTGVTDAGLKHLKDVPNLKVLVLWEAKVTDKGLDHLKELKKLQVLNVKDTKVTAEGAAKLTKALPKLDLIR